MRELEGLTSELAALVPSAIAKSERVADSALTLRFALSLYRFSGSGGEG